MVANSIQTTFASLIDLLQQLTDEAYTAPCEALSNATIGQHTRHSIELFQCLLSQYPTGQINYDLRARDEAIQTSTANAIQALEAIISHCDQPDKSLTVQQQMEDHLLHVETTYYRELLFTLDHCIHHQALIKVALQHTSVKVAANFGVARSTIAYRTQCVQ